MPSAAQVQEPQQELHPDAPTPRPVAVLQDGFPVAQPRPVAVLPEGFPVAQSRPDAPAQGFPLWQPRLAGPGSQVQAGSSDASECVWGGGRKGIP